MLRRNYRRTRSDETDVRSATGEELTGAMTVSVSESRPQSGRERTTAPPAVQVIASSFDDRREPGDGGSGGGDDDDDDDYDDDDNDRVSGGGEPTATYSVSVDGDDSADGVSPRDGHQRRHHQHRRHQHRRHHDHRRNWDPDEHDPHRRPVTPTPSCQSATPYRHNPSVGSADTEMTSLDTRELWLPDTEPTPSTMSALHQFGAEMLRLSRGLEKVASPESKPTSPNRSGFRYVRVFFSIFFF